MTFRLKKQVLRRLDEKSVSNWLSTFCGKWKCSKRRNESNSKTFQLICLVKFVWTRGVHQLFYSKLTKLSHAQRIYLVSVWRISRESANKKETKVMSLVTIRRANLITTTPIGLDVRRSLLTGGYATANTINFLRWADDRAKKLSKLVRNVKMNYFSLFLNIWMFFFS